MHFFFLWQAFNIYFTFELAFPASRHSAVFLMTIQKLQKKKKKKSPVQLTAFQFDLKAVQFIISPMIHSHSILHITSLQFPSLSALHFSRFPSFLHSAPMCPLTALESKDCLLLLLCNSIAYLRLPEIIVSHALFLDLFPTGILYSFIIMDH